MTATLEDLDLALRCDACGQTVTGLAATMHDWDLVWSLFSRHGWTGTRLATGPHRCTRCSRIPLSAAPPATTAPRTPGDWKAPPSHPTSGTVLCRQLDGVALVELAGDLQPGAPGIPGALLAATGAGRWPPHLILDLNRVTRLGPAARAELVAVRHGVALAGGHTCLAGLSPDLRRGLRTLCLLHLFVEFPSADAAVAWLHAGRSACA
jgi:anti-anti-sigma regulatory factor